MKDRSIIYWSVGEHKRLSHDFIGFCFWSVGEQTRLSHDTEDEAIRDFLEVFALPGGEWADHMPSTIEVCGWARKLPTLQDDDTLTHTLEYLDDEYGDPDGPWSKPTEAMRAAEQAYHAAVLADYETWACEVVERHTVDVHRWIADHDGGGAMNCSNCKRLREAVEKALSYTKIMRRYLSDPLVVADTLSFIEDGLRAGLEFDALLGESEESSDE